MISVYRSRWERSVSFEPRRARVGYHATNPSCQASPSRAASPICLPDVSAHFDVGSAAAPREAPAGARQCLATICSICLNHVTLLYIPHYKSTKLKTIAQKFYPCCLLVRFSHIGSIKDAGMLHATGHTRMVNLAWRYLARCHVAKPVYPFARRAARTGVASFSPSPNHVLSHVARAAAE